MSFFSRFTGRNRVRAATKRLGSEPTADNYVALAREHAVAGDMQRVLSVCKEGLEVHPGHLELGRIAHRANQINVEMRLRSVMTEIELSPRPALWREACELLLQSQRAEQAAELASSWFEAIQDTEAKYYRAQALTEQFFGERRGEIGREAYELADEARKLAPADIRPLQLIERIATQIGAWEDARKAVARMLELRPGDPYLENRFRNIISNCHESMNLNRAFLELERTGRFSDDVSDGTPTLSSTQVRPALQELGSAKGVEAAVFLRGGTALVQGPIGATADRTARSVREIAQHSRDAARRLALGRLIEVQLEGDFGSMSLVPGEHGIAAIWTDREPDPAWLETLSTLAGSGGSA